MPLLATVGGASARGFGFTKPSVSITTFIVASEDTVYGNTVYIDPTNSNYKIHQFTTTGTFTITSAPVNPTVEVMMVGGGGGGTFGGGGAGGYIYRSAFPISTGSFVVGVGASSGGQGNSTSFSTLVALGGGYINSGGGSGGGGVDASGGAGLQPTSASGGFGNAGGNWNGGGFDGGGGGAGGAGSVPDGGDGKTADIISSSGAFDTFAQGGWGVLNSVAYALPAVVANSGNGGWGGGYNDENGNYVNQQAGQAGIVRIRYKFQ